MAEIENIENLEVVDMEQVEQELERARTGYYRDKYRLLVVITLLFSAVNIILIIVLFYLYLSQPKVPQEFYTSNLYNGYNTSIYPLDSPLINSDKVMEWASSLIIKTFNFNFVNYLNIFNEIKLSYTDAGWTRFSDFLTKSGLLDSIVNNKFFLSSIVSGKAKLLYDGVINGRHAWHIKIPAVLMFKPAENAASPQMQKKIIVDMVVTRVPTIENQENIGVDSINITWEK